MMDQPQNPFSPLPLKLMTTLSVQRVEEIVDRLNFVNDRYPLKMEIVSGPMDLDIDEPRYVEISCASFGKIKHFLDEFDELCGKIERGELLREQEAARNRVAAMLAMPAADRPAPTTIQAVEPAAQPMPASQPIETRKRLEDFQSRSVPAGLGLDFG